MGNIKTKIVNEVFRRCETSRASMIRKGCRPRSKKQQGPRDETRKKKLLRSLRKFAQRE